MGFFQELTLTNIKGGISDAADIFTGEKAFEFTLDSGEFVKIVDDPRLDFQEVAPQVLRETVITPLDILAGKKVLAIGEDDKLFQIKEEERLGLSAFSKEEILSDINNLAVVQNTKAIFTNLGQTAENLSEGLKAAAEVPETIADTAKIAIPLLVIGGILVIFFVATSRKGTASQSGISLT